jgi:predicted RNase H-like HicB family nuclease
MIDTRRYPAQVFWSDDDKAFVAVATDLPGCSAVGDTQDEALRELQDAIVAWIGAARSARNPIPEPSSPATNHQYSGKVLLRMPRALHAQLSQRAQYENVSLNQYIVFLLSSARPTWEQFTHHSLSTLLRSSAAWLRGAQESGVADTLGRASEFYGLSPWLSLTRPKPTKERTARADK